MNEIQKYEIKLRKIADKALILGTTYKFTLLFVILGTAVGFALLRTSTFLDIPRNETRYTEESARIKYKQIDQKVLEKFEEAQEDANVEVGSQFDPNRTNPFSE
jgi:hypothetical protein